MKKLFKTNVFRKFFRPRYRIPNGIIKSKRKSPPLTIEELEFIHEIISKKREERNK